MFAGGCRLVHEKRHGKESFRDGKREFERKFTKSVTISTVTVTENVNRRFDGKRIAKSLQIIGEKVHKKVQIFEICTFSCTNKTGLCNLFANSDRYVRQGGAAHNLFFQRSLYQAHEQRMGLVRTGLEFRVILDADKERV